MCACVAGQVKNYNVRIFKLLGYLICNTSVQHDRQQPNHSSTNIFLPHH